MMQIWLHVSAHQCNGQVTKFRGQCWSGVMIFLGCCHSQTCLASGVSLRLMALGEFIWSLVSSGFLLPCNACKTGSKLCKHLQAFNQLFRIFVLGAGLSVPSVQTLGFPRASWHVIAVIAVSMLVLSIHSSRCWRSFTRWYHQWACLPLAMLPPPAVPASCYVTQLISLQL